MRSPFLLTGTRLRSIVLFGTLVAAALIFTGCAAQSKDNRQFQTSGNREADQRAEQIIAKDQQVKGNKPGLLSQSNEKSLYDRMGGEKNVQQIVDDFVTRAMANPRVNWERKGVQIGGVLGIGGHKEPWKPTPQNVATLKLHLAQFIALASGGPSTYQGREIKQVHQGMKISNAEFDAAVGDLKATLDKFQIGTPEQKELLAIIESTRPQIVEER